MTNNIPKHDGHAHMYLWLRIEPGLVVKKLQPNNTAEFKFLVSVLAVNRTKAMKPGGSFCPARGPECSPTWCIVCSSQIIRCIYLLQKLVNRDVSLPLLARPSYKTCGSFANFFHSGPTLTFAVLESAEYTSVASLLHEKLDARVVYCVHPYISTVRRLIMRNMYNRPLKTIVCHLANPNVLLILYLIY